jgi:hypothetical protein
VVALIQCTWDDVPHILPSVKEELWASIPPYQRAARSKGQPALGSGVIYPVPEDTYTIPPFPIPEEWPKAYGLDVGWNRTAGVFAAWDQATDTVYIFAEHYLGKATPTTHTATLNAIAKGWMTGAVDPASRISNQKDGSKLFDEYTELGLLLVKADNAVEAGIMKVWRRLNEGRLKIFSSCPNLLGELRTYRRDDKGKVVKVRDHACDALRYLIMTGMMHASVQPQEDDEDNGYASLGRNRVTGY